MYPGTTFEEDDEKIILTMKQCGSGGRLINKGAYEGPHAYRKFKKAAPYTWGEEGLPIYCGHCVWGPRDITHYSDRRTAVGAN